MAQATDAKRASNWQSCQVFAVLVFIIFACEAFAFASCGDYLLHGDIGARRDAHVSSNELERFPISHLELPIAPGENSPCANGRCRQSTPPVPTNPNQTVTWRHTASLGKKDEQVLPLTGLIAGLFLIQRQPTNPMQFPPDRPPESI